MKNYYSTSPGTFGKVQYGSGKHMRYEGIKVRRIIVTLLKGYPIKNIYKMYKIKNKL